MLKTTKSGERQTSFRTGTLASGMLLAALSAASVPAGADPVSTPLSRLESQLAESLRLKAAESQIDFARHQLLQEQSKEGLQVYGRVDAGHHRQIVTNDLTRTYNALSPHVGVSYPLLGSRARQLESVMGARTQLQMDSIDFEDTRRGLLYDLRRYYVALWQYQQQAQVAQRYVETLEESAPAARKLMEKGLWTDASYLNFSSNLASARDELKRFRSLQQLALNAVRTSLSKATLDIAPQHPELPPVCLASSGLEQSAMRNSTGLKKLEAKLQSLTYNQEIDAGSSVDSDVHFGVSYIDEISGSRTGYQAAAGVSFSMPANFQEANRANRDKLRAAVLTQRSLVEQTRMDIQTGSRAAQENFQLAKNSLNVAQEQAKAAREALREARVQFNRVPQPIFDELMQKTTMEYQASQAEIEGQAGLLLKTNDILLLAPDSCMDTGTRATLDLIKLAELHEEVK